MARNIELLTRLRDKLEIEAEQSRLEMGVWATVSDEVVLKDGVATVSCGTTACAAGWTVQLNGDKLFVTADDYTVAHRYELMHCVARNGRVMRIWERARKLLGLSEEEANTLFLDCDGDTVFKALDILISGRDILDYYEEC